MISKTHLHCNSQIIKLKNIKICVYKVVGTVNRFAIFSFSPFPTWPFSSENLTPTDQHCPDLSEWRFSSPVSIRITEPSSSTWIHPAHMFSTTQRPSGLAARVPSKVCRSIIVVHFQLGIIFSTQNSKCNFKPPPIMKNVIIR